MGALGRLMQGRNTNKELCALIAPRENISYFIFYFFSVLFLFRFFFFFFFFFLFFYFFSTPYSLWSERRDRALSGGDSDGLIWALGSRGSLVFWGGALRSG